MKDTKAYQNFMQRAAEQSDQLSRQIRAIMAAPLDSSPVIRQAQIDLAETQEAVQKIECSLLDARFELLAIGGRQ